MRYTNYRDQPLDVSSFPSSTIRPMSGELAAFKIPKARCALFDRAAAIDGFAINVYICGEA